MFAPPFRDPFNYVFDPLIPLGIDLLGAAMHARFAAESKPGVTMRSGSTYSTWWNGGLRTTAYFHNEIGLLTETIGNPTPIDIPFIAGRASCRAPIFRSPIAPQRWHFRQSIEYRADRQPRRVRCGVALSRDAALQHLPDGEERHRARQPGHLDSPCRHIGTRRTASHQHSRPGRAMRAATSCPRISRTS